MSEIEFLRRALAKTLAIEGLQADAERKNSRSHLYIMNLLFLVFYSIECGVPFVTMSTSLRTNDDDDDDHRKASTTMTTSIEKT